MKRHIDLSFYLVTHREHLSIEKFFQIIQLAIEGGVKIIQLREKSSSTSEMIEIANQLLSILKPHDVPLIINDRVDVAHAVKADGVHLGQSDLTVAEARAILGKDAIIGLSVETLAQTITANTEDVDYVAASPLFSSKTKSDCQKPWGLNGLKQLCLLSHHPVVAIGGIEETSIESIVQCGVAGVAVVSAIFDAPCPKTAAERISNRMNHHALL